MEALQIYQGSNLPSKVSDSSISIFKDEPLTDDKFSKGMDIIKSGFPKLNMSWFLLLKERCQEKGFTNERFRAAVYNMIDSCVYSEPTIASILNFDQRIETLTQVEMLEKQKTFGETIWNYYERIDIDGQLFFTPNGNIQKYGLKKWEPKQAEPKVIIHKDPDPKKWDGMFKEVLQELDEQIGDKKQ